MRLLVCMLLSARIGFNIEVVRHFRFVPRSSVDAETCDSRKVAGPVWFSGNASVSTVGFFKRGANLSRKSGGPFTRFFKLITNLIKFSVAPGPSPRKNRKGLFSRVPDHLSRRCKSARSFFFLFLHSRSGNS